MKKIKVIKRDNLPMRPPVLLTIVSYLLLKEVCAGDIVWGIVGTIIGLGWMAWITRLIKEEDQDIFGD